jgi:hypothetical protein
MHIRHAALVACAALLATSCGSPSEPEAEPPDIRGVWTTGTGRTWFWGVRSLAAPSIVETTACQGSLDITEQIGASFAGRYTISCTTARSSSGLVDGLADGNGQLSFRLRTEQGGPPELLPERLNYPCPVGSDPGIYEGTFDREISARRLVTVECPSGQIQVTASFLGARG